MLRALFCISCCSAPPSSRASKQRKVSSPGGPAKQKLEQANNQTEQDDKKSEVGNEKDQLLANQISVNNENYGSKSGSQQAQGKISSHASSGNNPIATITTPTSNSDQSTRQEEDSITAATSSSLLSKQTFLQRQGAFDSSSSSPPPANYDTQEERQRLYSQYDDQDVSPPSSIDADQFTESATSGNVTQPPRDESFEQQGQQQQQLATQQQVQQTRSPAMGSTTSGQSVEQTEAPNQTQTATARNVPSTTKIGDYARIEYSPVDDLESITTMSYSRFGSEKGGRSQAGSTLSRQNSMKAKSTDGSEAARSRRSSQGIESTSISIASQLSNEQLQQNLTNMLESANSPNPMYGTIGLPLGPPLEGTMTAETAKTSPETTGAALTSASQDSLSDTSLGDMPASKPGTLRSNVSVGAALVNDSMDDSADLSVSAPLATGEADVAGKGQPSNAENVKPTERVGSPVSMATTTSGGLTAPTPTPSELSTSSTKKKKLKAKALFKRFKGGSKSKKSKDEGD